MEGPKPNSAICVPYFASANALPIADTNLSLLFDYILSKPLWASPDEPELLGETDAHWHDVIGLRLWMRKTIVEGKPGKYKVEPWIVSASLDGTLRKWRLLGELCLYLTHGSHQC